MLITNETVQAKNW